MRLIKETKSVGSDVYERTVGTTCNLHEFIEAAETADGFMFHDIPSGEEYYVGGDVEYEVFVSGKPVDASKISISIYDTEEDKPTYYECAASGEELDLEDIEEAQALTKLSKEELIAKVMHYKAGNG